MARVAFIGLGHMGGGMAPNLAKAGHDVRAFDLSEEALAHAVERGCKRAKSAAEACKDADAVITMLPAGKHVAEVFRSSVFGAAPANAILLDCSTIDVGTARQVTADAVAAGYDMVDAPVSGGPMGAKNGTLSIMVGGRQEAFDRARPILAGMGTTITRVGDSGAGQTVKLCNQLVCGLNIQAVCEALALARASGVDLAQLRDVLMGGSAASWMLDKLGPAMIDGDTKAGFRIDLMLKDLRLVQQQALTLGVPLPGTALMTSLYVGARAHREGDNGNQALFRVYDRLANQSAR